MRKQKKKVKIVVVRLKKKYKIRIDNNYVVYANTTSKKKKIENTISIKKCKLKVEFKQEFIIFTVYWFKNLSIW